MRTILEILIQIADITPILALNSIFPWESNFEVSDDITVLHQEDGSVLVRLLPEALDIWRVDCSDAIITMTQLASSGRQIQADFESVLAACGIRDRARNDAEGLYERAQSVDSAFCLLRKLKQIDAADTVGLAVELLTLSDSWARNRLARFCLDGSGGRLDEAYHSLRSLMVGLETKVSGLERIEPHEDPRGSCFTLHFNRDGVYETEVQHLALNWTPTSIKTLPKSIPTKPDSNASMLPRPTKVNADVLGVLAQAHVVGNEVSIPQRLSPKAYAKVKAVLEELGGSWHTGRQSFIYEEDPAPMLDSLIEHGSMLTRRDYEFFPTPPHLVQQLIQHSLLKPGMKVLEPEAGSAAIALAAAEVVGKENVTCYELMPRNVDKLKAMGFSVSAPTDFLSVQPVPTYDVVLMNPPFSGGKDVAHVLHALQFLKPKGEVWAIMSTTWQTGDIQRSVRFRELVESHGLLVQSIERGAFGDSGTDVPTVLVGLKVAGPHQEHGSEMPPSPGNQKEIAEAAPQMMLF